MSRLSKLFGAVSAIALTFTLVGCGNTASTGTQAPTASGSVESTTSAGDPEYSGASMMSPEELNAVIDDSNYLLLDVRKAEDFEKGHIKNTVSADMDAAKNGDEENGKQVMESAVGDSDADIVLICYSGKSYAQAGAKALEANGYDMSKVHVLEGGMKAWDAAYPDSTVTD